MLGTVLLVIANFNSTELIPSIHEYRVLNVKSFEWIKSSLRTVNLIVQILFTLDLWQQQIICISGKFCYGIFKTKDLDRVQQK